MLRDSPVTLEATFSSANKALEVHYRVINRGKQPIYIYNQLWKLSKGQYIPDPASVYRFFEKGKLTLLLGAAPLPTTMLPTYRNEPDVLRVDPASALDGTLSMNIPVSEHNCYFVEADPKTAPDHARLAELLVEYADANDITLQPSNLSANARKITTPGAFEKRRAIRSGPVSVDVEVSRRLEDFSRLRAD